MYFIVHFTVLSSHLQHSEHHTLMFRKAINLRTPQFRLNPVLL